MFGLARTQPGRPQDNGAIAMIYTFVIILAIGILGLVADIGRAMAERRDAQTAADLSALAGGQDLPEYDIRPRDGRGLPAAQRLAGSVGCGAHRH